MSKPHRSPKPLGELAEAVFFLRALALGYILCKPFGDCAPFDWVVAGLARTLKRVQVKAAFSRYPGKAYRVNTRTYSGRPYTLADTDFIAAWVAPENAWYIIPIAALGSRTEINLYPEAPHKDRLWGRSREAWRRLGKVRTAPTFGLSSDETTTRISGRR